jgi:hypothetical protein
MQSPSTTQENVMTDQATQTTDCRALAEELSAIQQEMLTLLDDARHLLRQAPGMTGQRAKAYWLAHVTMALSRDHDYLGGSMVTMQDTLTKLLEAAEDAPSDED